MSRPTSYDREVALELACKAFWEHGYQALGVREIEELTGLNQYAIRSGFGGKEGLYVEVLKFYSDAAISTELAPLNSGGLAEIETFLKKLVTEGSAVSSPWGCLIVNTGIENARVNSKKLDEAVEKYWKALESHFGQALENARESGEVKADINVNKIAKGLVTAIMGIHARNRATRTFDGGHDLVDLVRTSLDALRLK